MAEPAARESYTPSHNAASDALCMLHTLAMIRKITGGGGGGRGGGASWWTVCLRARTIVTLCLRRCVSCQHCKSIVRRKRGLGTDHVDRLDPLHGVQGPSVPSPPPPAHFSTGENASDATCLPTCSVFFLPFFSFFSSFFPMMDAR